MVYETTIIATPIIARTPKRAIVAADLIFPYFPYVCMQQMLKQIIHV